MALFIKRKESLFHDNEIHVVARQYQSPPDQFSKVLIGVDIRICVYRIECMHLLFVSVSILYCFCKSPFLFLVLPPPRYVCIYER
jgi:hypothetical protein